MIELPWFPMYARDWLGGEGPAMMLPEQEGAFIRLLLVAWGDGTTEPSIPDDDRALAQMSRLAARWKKLGPLVRDQFTARNGRLYNDKLSGIWNEQVERSRRLAENGRKGGRAKARPNQNGSAAQAEPKPGLSNDEARPYHIEAEADTERETTTTTSSGAASENDPVADPLARRLTSPADRQALAAMLGRVPHVETWRAEMLASLDAMPGHTTLTPQQLGKAVREFVGNGAATNPNLRQFRRYLEQAAAAEDPPKARPINGHRPARNGVGGGSRNDAAIDASVEQLEKKYGN